MRREKGFTLIELAVVVATLMVLAATAIPFYATYRQRIIASEALVMLKSIIDAEIMYYLEHETFYPLLGGTILIDHDDPPGKPEIGQVKEALKVLIPVGHRLNFTITHMPETECLVQIQSFNGEPIFKGGSSLIWAKVDKDGEIDPPFH